MAFARLFVAAVASLSLVTSVQAVPFKRWDADKFGSYDDYHASYNALDCRSKHNTDFFESCCHPVPVGQSLPSQCTPDSGASASNTTSTSLDGLDLSNVIEVEDGEDCPDGYEPIPDDAPVDSTNSDASGTTTLTEDATSTSAAPSSTSKKHKASSTSASPSEPTDNGNSSEITNDGAIATWYTQDNQAGACGKEHSDDDLIGAMNFQRYGDVNAVSSLCGKSVTITNLENKKKVTIIIADACPSCPNEDSIDLSRGAFSALTDGDFDKGEVHISWHFNN
ncbi:hypothetical protein FRB99_000706 [Tulasnella sp. 403]|nr:hypothetical protein FRB99_000706 [Tulasnella sp. 403]